MTRLVQSAIATLSRNFYAQDVCSWTEYRLSVGAQIKLVTVKEKLSQFIFFNFRFVVLRPTGHFCFLCLRARTAWEVKQTKLSTKYKYDNNLVKNAKSRLRVCEHFCVSLHRPETSVFLRFLPLLL